MTVTTSTPSGGGETAVPPEVVKFLPDKREQALAKAAGSWFHAFTCMSRVLRQASV